MNTNHLQAGWQPSDSSEAEDSDDDEEEEDEDEEEGEGPEAEQDDPLAGQVEAHLNIDSDPETR